MNISDQKWRLNNLYRIVDRDSNSIKFQLNKVQEDVLDNLHNRNIILKARQLGMSTFAVLYLLDQAIWHKNLACGIVSYSLEHAQHIFKKIIGHAIDKFPTKYADSIQITQRSAREITFANGSSLRVDTTLRGGSYPLVLVSEFGKTCARNPQKAEEVITGTLQSVPRDGLVIIESTGEGNSGYFADMVMESSRRGNEKLSNIEYKLFFYSWLEEPSYRIEEKIDYDVTLTDYFNRIEKETGRIIDQQQRNWYALQNKLLGDKIKQEFPSTVSESFLTSSDAYYFAEAINEAYTSGRCLYSSLYDGLLPVFVAMDIGVNDLTVMVFFQVAHGEVRVIDYYEDKNKGVDFYAKFLLQDKKFLYHTIFLPHDSVKRDPLDTSNTYERDFQRLFSGTNTKFHVLKKMDKQLSISHAKNMISRCVFNASKVKPFLDHITKYRKKWSEQLGKYMEEPLHDIHCFIGETKVLIKDGEKRIDEIKIGDYVITPNGYKKVNRIYKYKTDNLINIKTSEFEIKCTSNHKIFTSKGLTNADSIMYNSYILTKKDENIWKKIGFIGKMKKLGFKDFFISMSQKQLSSLMEENIGLMNSDITEAEKGILFKEEYGNFTTEKSPKTIIFTTLMEIQKIMKYQISNVCQQVNISKCIKHLKEEKFLEKFFSILKHKQKQKSGEILRKVKSFIKIMEKNVLKIGQCWIKFAIYVKNLIDLNGLDLVYVHQIVGLKIEVYQEKIMKQEYAYCVPQNLNAINIIKKNYAQENVQIEQDHLKEKKQIELNYVKYAEKNLTEKDILNSGHVLEVAELNLDIETDVYDIEVEDDHCYFANGILVSNSNHGDCFQYMTQAVAHLEVSVGLKGALEKHRKVIDERNRRVY